MYIMSDFPYTTQSGGTALYKVNFPYTTQSGGTALYTKSTFPILLSLAALPYIQSQLSLYYSVWRHCLIYKVNFPYTTQSGGTALYTKSTFPILLSLATLPHTKSTFPILLSLATLPHTKSTFPILLSLAARWSSGMAPAKHGYSVQVYFRATKHSPSAFRGSIPVEGSWHTGVMSYRVKVITSIFISIITSITINIIVSSL